MFYCVYGLMFEIKNYYYHYYYYYYYKIALLPKYIQQANTILYNYKSK